MSHKFRRLAVIGSLLSLLAVNMPAYALPRCQSLTNEINYWEGRYDQAIRDGNYQAAIAASLTIANLTNLYLSTC